jgi:hypothetical protein
VSEQRTSHGSVRRKYDRDISVGDIIVFFGTPHRVDRIDPPSDATLSFFPTCIGYARSNNGWGISLDGDSPFPNVEVL